eukprot:CAMPEP_0197318928 /NCGR_PEP_ID=MMETSP0891-20130614/52766_1 /TAXON_ID=44058 ORGANISM="Aureoumbra lagunensis, Strain CCMP1510" /NCGR_SAMPLE_ID=MMETSP0891 /ASSEMBLY_ACC=CAM_ASM_000534 /LENGTH=349 /DNA_ID=CAMNT_0042809581 /DNA_START=1 /DNA_END=1051 /DNA_ORIENTATION=+
MVISLCLFFLTIEVMGMSMTLSRREFSSKITHSVILTTNFLPRKIDAVLVESAQCQVLARELRIRVPNVAVTGDFFEKALGMQRVGTQLFAFGPTSLERPPSFFPGISTFDQDGGHFAIRLEEGAESTFAQSISYIQFALPNLRASKIISYGGIINEAYGVVDVLAPGNVPCRLLLGDEVRDRTMFLSLRVTDLSASLSFYQNLGFHKAPYPRARPPTNEESPFDPNPPRNSVYLTPCDDSFGILLVPTPTPFRLALGSAFKKKQDSQILMTKSVKEKEKDSLDDGDSFLSLDLLVSDESIVKESNFLYDPDGLPLRVFLQSSTTKKEDKISSGILLKLKGGSFSAVSG